MNADRGPATMADIEALFSDTIERVGIMDENIHEMQEHLKALPEMNSMVKAIINTQTMVASSQITIAEAAKDMTGVVKNLSATFEKAEIRQAQLEIVTTKLYEHKGVSNTIFLMVVGTLSLVILVLVVWGTGLYLKGSFTNLEIGQKQVSKEIKSKVDDSTSEIIEQVNKNEKGETP